MRDSRDAHGPIILVFHAGQFIAAQHVRSFDPEASAEHKVFHAMWSRCTNPNHSSYRDYGKRGITVCDRWKNFAYFFVDMGARPTPKHRIERRDNNRGYEPSNCYWATQKEQGANKRNTVFVTVNGERMPLPTYADGITIPLHTIHSRLRMGWDLDRAVNSPVRLCKRGADRKPPKAYKKRLKNKVDNTHCTT